MKIVPIEDGTTDFGLVYLKTTNKDIRPTPHCDVHGAMTKVSAFGDTTIVPTPIKDILYLSRPGYWRCCTAEGIICRAGCIQTE